MKERVAADAASTDGRLATRFQYVTRIEDLCGARNTGLGVRPPGPALASGLLEQCIVINDFASALEA